MSTQPAREFDTDVSHAGFDPTAGVFVAQDSRPDGLGQLDPASLTPFQRALLVIDGTVTKFIEAWAFEPIDVLRLDQVEQRLPAANPWLQVAEGATVIRRRVMLRGRRSGKFFAWADSVIAAERVDPEVRYALECADGGLGKILIDAGAETRREGLWFGRERCSNVPVEVAACWNGEFLTRSYRVLASGRPMMLITERFPL